MKTIRWAILGAGKIARSFVKDFPLMKHATLAAVASSDPKRAKQFAAECNIRGVLTYDELYKSDEIDAVYVATTHNFHFEHTRNCLLHGKAVLCEKPITVTDRDFKTLMELAKENQLFLMEAMWTYFLPAVQKAKAWLDQGRIGKLKVIQSDFAFAMEKKLEGRLYNPNLAGGALLDLGIYPIAMAYLFSGARPEKILSTGALAETGVDETIGMLFQYRDLTASLFTSLVTRMTNATRIFGEEGYIEICEFWKAKQVSLFDKDHKLIETFDDGRTAHGFIYEMQHANNMILAGNLESPVMPHSRSNDIQETMMEIRRQVDVKYPFE